MKSNIDKPFEIEYDWADFNNTLRLTSFQKHRIKSTYEESVKTSIQGVIDESIKNRKDRKKELQAHTDPANPFKLDIGGEG